MAKRMDRFCLNKNTARLAYPVFAASLPFYTHPNIPGVGLPVVVQIVILLRHLPAQQVIVQIVILLVKFATVDHCASFGLTAYLGRRPASGFVIVQVGQDRRMRSDSGHCFGKVRYGVEHDSVGAGATFPAHRHIREIIHESFEHGYRIAAAGECRDGLGRSADLEATVAQLPATAVVAETDGKVFSLAAGTVIDFPAIAGGYL